MKIAFVAAECSPLIKVGGLADVVGSLPRALVEHGHDVRIFIPAYESIDRRRFPSQATSWSARVLDQGRPVLVHIRETVLPNTSVPVYLVEWPGEFAGPVYALAQDTDTLRSGLHRFVRFSQAVTALIGAGRWQPDVVHCHDWHTALVPSLLKAQGSTLPTVLTIHNLDIQGRWSAAEVADWLNRDTPTQPVVALDYHQDANLLLTGITTASRVTTVSPTYASEIMTPAFGEHLDGALRARGVVGIVNGIDTASYDPHDDLALSARYDTSTWLAGKAQNKRDLQNELGLPDSPNAPLFVNIGRLVPQKGVDLIVPLLEKVASAGGQVAFLGSGFPEIESVLRSSAERLPGVGVRVGFDSALGRRMYAGGDFFLMPSRFEPCGLGQLIAMRYGTIPVVRDTGGLHDTVIDAELDRDRGFGFRFTAPTSEDLWATMSRAIAAYHQPRILAEYIRRSMALDHSWYTSAIAYAQLYEQARE